MLAPPIRHRKPPKVLRRIAVGKDGTRFGFVTGAVFIAGAVMPHYEVANASVTGGSGGVFGGRVPLLSSICGHVFEEGRFVV